MNTNTTTPACPNCVRLQAELDALRQQFELLQRQVAALRKDSSTSSKPPSSDIVKPPKPAPPPGQSKRQRGGQPGHPKHERSACPPEMFLEPPVDHRLLCCPDCQGNLHPSELLPRILQQIDIPVACAFAIEHRSFPGWCPTCQVDHYASFPVEVQAAGLVGPRLTTLIAYMKGACHASYSTIRKFLRDVLQVTISRGQLSKVIDKVSESLEGTYTELLQDLPGQAFINTDETGHKQNGQRMWTWCFRAKLYCLFKIDATRSADVLIEVLGEEFNGVLGCDFYSAYRRYMREFDVTLQFCLAHLIREVKFLLTQPDWRDQHFGSVLLSSLRGLFKVIHRRAELSAEEFEQQLTRARDNVLGHSKATIVGRQGELLRERLAKYGEGYFRFITTPGVEPTNNLAEQAIRFVVLDRIVTQGTRSEKGNRWCERIWTVIATCTQQGRSVFEYLHAAVVAHFQGSEGPTLLPQGN